MRRGLDRQAVVDTAIAIADESGYDGLTLSHLATRLGIRTPSLYNHIESLESLRQDLALTGLHGLHEALKEGAIGQSGDNACLAMSTRYLEFVRNHPGLYEATMRIPDMQDQKIQAASEAIVQLVQRVLAPLNLSEEDSIIAVRGLRSLVHGFATLESHQGFSDKYGIDASLRQIVSTYLAGLKHV